MSRLSKVSAEDKGVYDLRSVDTISTNIVHLMSNMEQRQKQEFSAFDAPGLSYDHGSREVNGDYAAFISTLVPGALSGASDSGKTLAVLKQRARSKMLHFENQQSLPKVEISSSNRFNGGNRNTSSTYKGNSSVVNFGAGGDNNSSSSDQNYSSNNSNSNTSSNFSSSPAKNSSSFISTPTTNTNNNNNNNSNASFKAAASSDMITSNTSTYVPASYVPISASKPAPVSIVPVAAKSSLYNRKPQPGTNMTPSTSTSHKEPIPVSDSVTTIATKSKNSMSSSSNNTMQNRIFASVDPSDEEASCDPYFKRADFEWSTQLDYVNKNVFGISSFRPMQRECINAVLSGRDVFVQIPTGGGKSLCYQLAALVSPGFTVVISPLLSLMQDQTQQLLAIGISCAVINGNTTSNELFDTYRKGETGELKLLYITPEKLIASGSVQSWLTRMHNMGHFSIIAIDEAHCVSQWGHDFRNDYLKLGILRDLFPKVPIMALTATATDNVIKSVIEVLQLRNCVKFKRSFNRPNLFYEVRAKKESTLFEDIATEILTHFRKDSGIIYCLSRKKCEELAQFLRDKKKIRACFYHAEMTESEKKEAQSKWSSGEYHVVCATIAFGMGINKSNVRYVIHANMPKSMEGYYQESGRAGRDGKYAKCILYYSGGDMQTLLGMVGDNAHLTSREKDLVNKANKARINRMYSFCMDKQECRRVATLAYFEQSFTKAACQEMCDNCTSTVPLIDVDITEPAMQLCLLINGITARNPNHCSKTALSSLIAGKYAKSVAFLEKFHYESVPGFGFAKTSQWHGGSFLAKHIDPLFCAVEKSQLLERQVSTVWGAKGINAKTEKWSLTALGHDCLDKHLRKQPISVKVTVTVEDKTKSTKSKHKIAAEAREEVMYDDVPEEDNSNSSSATNNSTDTTLDALLRSACERINTAYDWVFKGKNIEKIVNNLILTKPNTPELVFDILSPDLPEIYARRIAQFLVVIICDHIHETTGVESFYDNSYLDMYFNDIAKTNPNKAKTLPQKKTAADGMQPTTPYSTPSKANGTPDSTGKRKSPWLVEAPSKKAK